MKSQSNAHKPSSIIPGALHPMYNNLASSKWDYPFVGLLLLCEAILGMVIIQKVSYTEIDWQAYMEEVDFWLDGEYDYRKIYGGTGPLVYPAGFLYLFGLLQWATDRDIRQAQYVFLGFYLLIQGVMFAIYTQVVRLLRNHKDLLKSETRELQMSHRIWSLRIAIGCLCLSKRYHSIFLLRLFNDGPTMLLAYLSFWCFINHRWNIGCFVFSCAVSVKMNVLLFAPGLLFLLLQASPKLTVPRLSICGITQLVLGAPFLLRHPVSYLRKAFELDRVFFFKWTVNFKFLPEELFLSKEWAIFLLVLHLSLLGVFLSKIYRRKKPLTAIHIASTLFISNFIGVCCARSLHYQFYSWYFATLPYLLWVNTPYPMVLNVLLLIAIEISFLTFPATPTSSLVLQLAHWSILVPCVLGYSIEGRSEEQKKKSS